MLVSLAALALAASPDLAAAEQAFSAGDFDPVLPAIEQALRRPLEPAERLRAHELAAMTHAAFDQLPAAIESFRRCLALKSDYAPPEPVSPKLQRLFAEARALGPLEAPPAASAPSAAVSVTPVPAGPPAGEPPLLKRWWFWAAVGVVAAGAAGAATTVALTRPHVPAGNLGTGRLE